MALIYFPRNYSIFNPKSDRILNIDCSVITSFDQKKSLFMQKKA